MSGSLEKCKAGGHERGANESLYWRMAMAIGTLGVVSAGYSLRMVAEGGGTPWIGGTWSIACFWLSIMYALASLSERLDAPPS